MLGMITQQSPPYLNIYELAGKEPPLSQCWNRIALLQEPAQYDRGIYVRVKIHSSEWSALSSSKIRWNVSAEIGGSGGRPSNIRSPSATERVARRIPPIICGCSIGTSFATGVCRSLIIISEPFCAARTYSLKWALNSAIPTFPFMTPCDHISPPL